MSDFTVAVDQGLARLWPKINADIERVREVLTPPPVLYIPQAPAKPVPPAQKPPFERLIALSVGGATLIVSVDNPHAAITRATKATGFRYRSLPKAKSLWIVERTQ